MNALPAIRTPNMIDPSTLGYPPGLAIELALREKSPQVLCAAYGIDEDRWRFLIKDPVFIADLQARVIELKTEGVSFKMKARAQAEALLTTSWDLIHSPNEAVPPSVKEKLITNTIRVAGLDGSRDQAAAVMGGGGTALQIVLHLGR